MSNTPMTVGEYVRRGGSQCPHCTSNDIEGSSVSIDSGGAWQNVSCNECGYSWDDIYRLDRYDNMEDREGHPFAAPTDGDPEIHKLMVLSTGHITKAANDLMQELTGEDSARQVGPGCHMDEYEFGFHIALTGEQDKEDQWIAPSLMDVCNYARKYGCTHLRLDRDGPEVKSLPTYNW